MEESESESFGKPFFLPGIENSGCDYEALRIAWENLDAIIAGARISEEELMEDFKKLCSESRQRKL